MNYILIPGVPGSAATWTPLRDVLPQVASWLCWPLESWDVPAGDDSAVLNALVNAVANTLRRAPRPTVVIGHSFGAWLAARAASRLSIPPERLILVAGMARITPAHRDGISALADALEQGQLTERDLVQHVIDLSLDVTGRVAAHELRIASIVAAMGLQRMVRLLRLVQCLADPGQALGHLPMATEVVHMGDDRAVPLAYGQELAGLGTGVGLTVLPGASHFPHWHNPADVAALVREA